VRLGRLGRTRRKGGFRLAAGVATAAVGFAGHFDGALARGEFALGQVEV
jgi:hypothetical protein